MWVESAIWLIDGLGPRAKPWDPHVTSTMPNNRALHRRSPVSSKDPMNRRPSTLSTLSTPSFWALGLALLLPIAPTLMACSAATEDPSTSEGDSESDLTKEPSLTFGTWKSPKCETVDDKTFQLRTYKIAANGVFADWNRFSSPTCSPESRLMTIRMGGSSKADRLSKTVSSAAEIRVFIDEKAIVPTSQAGIERLARECPNAAWKLGTELDVTKAGCGTLVPAHDACPIEYDLMRLKSGQLYFGDRSSPLCTEATRPKKLSVWSIAFDHAL